MRQDDPDRELRLSVLSDGWTFVVGAAIGVLITVISLVTIHAFGGGSDGGSANRGAALSGAAGRQPARGAAKSGDDGAHALRERCHQVFAAQLPVRKAANASLKQWEVHVDAMNKLVAGELTLQQATTFWDQTRVGAEQRLATYDAMRETLDRAPPCPVRRIAATDGATMACSQAVQAHAAELRRAAAALRTWRMHVRHMEMLRMGKMSPTRATQLWQHTWKLGARQLDAYHAAELLAEGLRC